MNWEEIIKLEKEKDYFIQLNKFISSENKKNKKIFPKKELIFNAFKSTPYDEVKVVILGQDPYHGVGQAHGLSFSVPHGITTPPSLKNIFLEIQNEYGGEIPTHGNLDYWSRQGVLLLNAVLTVESGNPNSHSGKGWETFTDSIIKLLSDNKEHLVFMLWGAYAGNKRSLIDENKHLVLTSPHPSPFSAHKGFLGNGHFKKANEYLSNYGIQPIEWQN